jgi:hypothetical protein
VLASLQSQSLPAWRSPLDGKSLDKHNAHVLLHVLGLRLIRYPTLLPMRKSSNAKNGLALRPSSGLLKAGGFCGASWLHPTSSEIFVLYHCLLKITVAMHKSA